MQNYEVGKRIGRGNYGTVFVAKDKRNGRWYCLKMIQMEAHSDEERQQAEEEVRLLKSMDHPGIVRYHEHFVHEDSLCVVMAYCEGGDLAQCIKKRAKAEHPFEEYEALDHVHREHKILHRDLKTSNIFISKAGHVRIGDFGIAKVLEGSTAAASTVIGTPYYMSPEVCQGQRYDFKSDVWALGCILYEICALQQAWNGSNLLGLVYKIVQEKQDPLPDRYSQELKNLVSHMLSKEPKGRPTLREILVLPFIRERMQIMLQPPAARPPSTGASTRTLPTGSSTAGSARPPAVSGGGGGGVGGNASSGVVSGPGSRSGSRPTSAELLARGHTPPTALGGPPGGSSSSGGPHGAIPAPDPRRHPQPAPMAPATPSSAASKPSMLPVSRASVQLSRQGSASGIQRPSAISSGVPSSPAMGGGGMGGGGMGGGGMGGGGMGGGGTGSGGGIGGCGGMPPAYASPQSGLASPAIGHPSAPPPPLSSCSPGYPGYAGPAQGVGGVGGGGFGGGGMGGGGCSAMPVAVPSDEPQLPSPALTPKQRMQQRKLAQADRRSVEVQQALAKRGADQMLARRLAAKAFSSDLSSDLTPASVPADREEWPESGSGATFRASNPSLADGGSAVLGATEPSFMGGGGCGCGGGMAYQPNYQSQPAGRFPRLAGDGIDGGGGGGGGDVYEADFEEDDDEQVAEEEMGEHATLRLARQQAEARSRETAASHQQRLASQAWQLYQETSPQASAGLEAALGSASIAEEVPEELPARCATAAAPHPSSAHVDAPHANGGLGDGCGVGGAPLQMVARHAGLKERCRSILGDLFPPVYDFLREARGAEADEKEVRRTLLSLVGRERVNDCMCVDELIFVESNY